MESAMKTGMTLVALATELERQKAAKRDYIAPARAMEMKVAEDGAPSLCIDTPEQAIPLAVNSYAHGQLASRLDIPGRYYRRMLAGDASTRGLLAANVNQWLSRDDGRHMVRTLDNTARAVLSDRYRTIDNDEIAEISLPILSDQPDMQIASCNISDTHLHIKALFPRIEGEVAVGDAVQAGIVISNSEVGAGAVSITPLIYRLVCLNGMIAQDGRFRAMHLGERAEMGAGAFVLYKSDTRRAEREALRLKLRDVVQACASRQYLDSIIQKMREANGDRIEGDVVKGVEVLAKQRSLSEDERGGVLRHLIEGGNLSRYGLLNAVTRQAQDVADYDRATALEAMGGAILELPRSQWREIALAA